MARAGDDTALEGKAAPTAQPAHEPRFLGVRRATLTFFATVVLPILTVVGGLIGWTIEHWPRSDEPEDAATVAERVSACMRQHDLDKARTVSLVPVAGPSAHEPGALIHTQRFRRCDWPPTAGADPDGYLEISAEFVVAVPDASEAEGTGYADVITAPCRRVRVAYSYAAQGYQERLDPVPVEVGSIVVAGSEETWPEGPVPFYFDRTQAVVLRNSKYSLDDVQCEGAERR